MARPKVFDDKPIFMRLMPGVRERIDALRGDQRQGDYVRDLLMAELERRESGRE